MSLKGKRNEDIMLIGKNKLDKSYLIKGLYYLASVLMPSILLFQLYNRNQGRNHIEFSHVLILAGILAIFGLLLFILFKFIAGSMEGALIVVLLCWLSFWLYEPMLGFVRRLLTMFFIPSRVYALLLLAIIGFVAILFRRKKPSFEKIRPAFNMLVICLIAMFLVNAVPNMSHHMAIVRVRAEIARLEVDERPFHIKREFNIDPTLSHPDIYWFHMDGLMSIETVERFWGLNYDHFREALQARGFLVYENAELNGGFTTSAMPALLSPAFYDSFWGEQLNHVETMLVDERETYLFRQSLASVGLGGYDDLSSYFELFNAFFAGGYELIVHTYFEYLPTSFDHLIGGQRIGSRGWQLYTRSQLPGLLAMTTPIPMIWHESLGVDAVRVRHLENIEPVASLTWFELMDAHMLSMEHRVTEPSEVPNHMRYDLYPSLGFEFSFWRMINEVDVILERNPNAVIVLQSDHGFHLDEVQRHLLEKGYSLEQVLELTHSVLSAVRIPDEYGGLEEPIAPLNITRVLVNRFIGENYQLVPSATFRE